MSSPVIKSKEEKTEDLKILKEWLHKQPHLPQKPDDQLLLRFLHICNYSLEQSKNLIDLFYTLRSQTPEIFANRDPTLPCIREVFENVDLIPLPKRTSKNYKVFLYRLRSNDADKYNFVNTNKVFFMLSDTRMTNETDFPDGEVPIFDMENYTLKHITKIVLPVLKKYMLYTQEAHPIKLREIHVINVPPFLDKCMLLIRPLMKSEVSHMLHFHQPNSTTLYDYIPKDLLPEEYGGTVGKISDFRKEWEEKVMKNRDYFLDEDKWHVDESKRPIENKNANKLYNMQGSFRSLNID